MVSLELNKQLNRLNLLRSDFMKHADSNDPSVWELDVNEIGGKLSGIHPYDDPVILLDCSDKSDGSWFLCLNSTISEIRCYPIETLTEEQISEIRKLVESFVVKKDENFF